MIRGVREKQHYLKALGLKAPINLRDFLPQKDSRILIVGMKRTGDLIAILPSIQALKNFFPNAHLVAMSSPDHETLLKSLPYVDEFLILPEYDDIFYRHASEYDLIISFRKWHDPPQSFQNFPPYFVFSTDLLVGPPKLAHIHYLDALRLLGVKSRATRPQLVLNQKTTEYAKRFFAAFGFKPQDTVIAVHPGSGYREKRWPAERYAAVVRWLLECYDARFIIVQGKKERDLVRTVSENIPEERIALLSDIPLLNVAAILTRCTFYLGNDSGIMHIADSVGCPTLTIFGPSRPGVWGATGKEAVFLVREDVWWSCPFCSGRHLKDKPCKRPNKQACLQEIQIEDVLGGIESLAALIRLRSRFVHLDSIKITDDLFKFPFGSQGIVLANLHTMRPMYIMQGRKKVEACLDAVREFKSYSTVLKKDAKNHDLLDALFTYRIIIPEPDSEEILDDKSKEDRTQILAHPLMVRLGPDISNNVEFTKKTRAISRKRAVKGIRRPRSQAKDKHRILFVNSIHPNIYGGGEKWMVRVGYALRERGHEILCWGLPKHKWLSDAQQNNLVCLNREIPLVFSYNELPHFVDYLKQLQLDAAVLNLERDIVSVGLPLRLAQVPLILARIGLPPVVDNPLLQWAYSHIIHGAITPSTYIRQDIINKDLIDPARIRVIPNGVDLKKFANPVLGMDTLRRDLSLEQDDKIILTIGRLAKQKGTEYLLRALPEILMKYTSVKLLIVGKGPQEKKLMEKVEQLDLSLAVRFLGERWDIIPLLAITECFVLPSLYEGMSTAMLEAMAAGVPVVATSVGDAPEVITDGINGILVTPRKTKELVKAINRVLERGRRNSGIVQKARELVRHNYSFKKMIDSTEDILRNGL